MSALSEILINVTQNKNGIEIGGPSAETGRIIYENSNLMDNVIFSKNTVWSKHTDDYLYYNEKRGKVFINDAVDITSVEKNSYDFCFSSHCLEHIANPLKAIKEWLRIVKHDGYIIIIVPEKSVCFDHNRKYTDFSILSRQYENNVGEDDLSTLPEILEKHDLSMDIPAGTFEQFKNRSLQNYNNRCLHHYVYSPDLLIKICNFFNCKFVFTETHGLHIWFIMQKIK